MILCLRVFRTHKLFGLYDTRISFNRPENWSSYGQSALHFVKECYQWTNVSLDLLFFQHFDQLHENSSWAKVQDFYQTQWLFDRTGQPFDQRSDWFIVWKMVNTSRLWASWATTFWKNESNPRCWKFFERPVFDRNYFGCCW